jgi:predicted nucleic acid-binding protein
MNYMTALDTNILIYACDKSDPVRQTKALDIISTTMDGILLWQVACEFIAASRKLAAQGFTPVHAWNRLAEYADILSLTLPNEMILERARILHLEEGLSFWDAMIVGACQEFGIKRLYSEDLPGKSVPGLEIINPFAD